MFGGAQQQQRQNAARDGVANEPTLDKDQEKKYEELVDLLLAGGYFRARIGGLSRFDKVVGGLAWCITSSNEDLDVDLFFQEEASMGQKIKLGENIIKALQKMKCPYRLESHQIQGGANTADFVNIFPIVQWLVKKVIETREETGDLMRLYSESQFNKSFMLPEEAVLKQKKEEASSFVAKVGDRYKADRKYRRGGRRVPYLNQRSEEETVQLALLEYGDFYKVNRSNANATGKPGIASELEGALGGGKGKKGDGEEDEEERRKAELKKQMSAYTSMGISEDVLGGLLPTNIGELESQYENVDGLSLGDNQKFFGMKLHQQNVNKLEREINQAKAEKENLQQIFDETERQLEEIQALYNKKNAYNDRIRLELKKLDELETPENTKQLQMLKGLVALNENLRNQEAQFKANCKKQRDELVQQIDEIKKELSGDNRSAEEAEIEETFRKDSDKLRALRALLAKKTRDIALVDRKIDEIPSRTELAQYQRMFVELYEQLAAKFMETRQYYNTYNTSEDTKGFLMKEVSILNSIHDNYKTAMNSKNTKDQMLDSISGIVKSVVQTFEKTETRLNTERDSKNKLNESYTALLDKERLYYKATKEFLEECKKNEILQSQLAS